MREKTKSSPSKNALQKKAKGTKSKTPRKPLSSKKKTDSSIQKNCEEKPKKVLALDLATKCGWAIVNQECPAHNGHPVVLYCGVFDLGSHSIKRWLNLEKEIKNLFKTHKPEAIIIEDNFVFKNVRTTAILNQLRGSVLLLAALHGLSVSFVDNNSAKKKIMGTTRYWDATLLKYVGISKEIMYKAVSEAICEQSFAPTGFDAADAIALALTYYDAPVPVIVLPRKPGK